MGGLPIIFYDHLKKVIGAAHAGRKGLSSGIIQRMILEFRAVYKSNPKDIIVGIGPGIERKCYKVDGELVDIRYQAHFFLLAEGITRDHIEDIDVCTKCSEDQFFSFRNEDDTERFVSVISLI